MTFSKIAIKAFLAGSVLCSSSLVFAEGRDPEDYKVLTENRSVAEPSVSQKSTSQAVSSPKKHTYTRNRGLQADESKASAIRPMIARHAAAEGVPYALADAVVRVESRYNPMARNGVNIGLTQINPLTAKSLGYEGTTSGLMNSDTNLRYGIKYLAGAYRLAGGDTCGTVLRYQAGHRAKSMTNASRAYCSKVKLIMANN